MSRRLSSDGGLPKASALLAFTSRARTAAKIQAAASSVPSFGLPPTLIHLPDLSRRQQLLAPSLNRTSGSKQHALPAHTHTLPVMTMPLKPASSSAVGSCPLNAK